MKARLFLKVCGVTVVAFGLAYFCFINSGEVFHSKHFFNSLFVKLSYKDYQDTTALKGVTKVIVHAENADVELKPAHNPEGHITLTTGVNMEHALHVERKGDTLIVNLANLEPYSNSELTIRLPDALTEIEVQDQQGDVILEKLTATHVTLATVGGDLKLKEDKIITAKLSSVNGDIKIHADIQQADIKSVSGDIKFDVTSSTPRYEINSVNGDIHITIPSSLATLISAQTINGDITGLDNKARANQPYYIHTKSVNGDITIN